MGLELGDARLQLRQLRLRTLEQLLLDLEILAQHEIQAREAAATIGFLTLAAALGIGNGAVFALVGRRSPSGLVGSVTGLVGAAGGLGGFLPPIVMGLVFQATASYAIGLMLLSNVAFVGATYTAWRLRPE